MICSLNHIGTLFKDFIHIPIDKTVLCTKIAFIICSHRHQGRPVIFRMNDHRIIFRLSEIQYRFHNFIFYFNKLHSFIDGFNIISCDQGHLVAHIAYNIFQNITVIRTCFRIGLSRLCKPDLRHIFISQDTLDSRNKLCF